MNMKCAIDMNPTRFMSKDVRQGLQYTTVEFMLLET